MDIITPRPSDLGNGFMVRRALPSAGRRAVGPFVFLDEMGPVRFEPGQGLDVRPHPHIGLATVTYLFEGEILHRDSLGSVAPIRPGDVNWMTAGRGIVHSERTPPALRGQGSSLWGLQCWVALPLDLEDCDPAFAHHEAGELPRTERDGARLRVVVGEAFGLRSPVAVSSPMFMVDAQLAPGARLALDADHPERAAYVVSGTVRADDNDAPACGPGQLLVFAPDEPAALQAGDAPVRLVWLGGAALDAPRFVWWNFVASRRQAIEEASTRWTAQAFPAVPGETEFIPLPERRLAPTSPAG